MTKVEQAKMLADIKACRKHVFKLCSQHMKLKKQNKLKEAEKLLKQIYVLERFLAKVHATAFI